MEDLSDYRKLYEKSALLETSIPEDPINLFHQWFHEVEDFGGVDEVNAMTVSTIGLDGFPKSRVVLLKKYSEEGFIFYTNYNSEKGKAITSNPNVCLSFFWHSLERQVIIKGISARAASFCKWYSSRCFSTLLNMLASLGIDKTLTCVAEYFKVTVTSLLCEPTL